ncbi:MAG: hypothetical protein H7221_08760 [Flavobacterium sp.]|nr:hypothetical protein [Flavobacterium sp.]
MKKLLLAFFITAIAISVNAQNVNRPTLSLGGELGAATGNLNLFYGLTAGATLQADFTVDKDLAITLNAGVIDFIGKKINNNIKYNSVAVIPILAGIKYYFTPVVYGSAQLGSSTFTTGIFKGTKFTYIPGIGFKVDKNIDILVKYTGLSNTGGTFGARVAYVF